MLAAENARRTLETGVTTVRDLGASGDVDYAMRDLISMGKMVGPRMFVAGQGLSRRRGGAPNPDAMRADGRGAGHGRLGLDQGLRLARQLQSVDTTQTLTFDEMKADVDAAHALEPSGRDPFVRRVRREGRGARRRRLDRARHRSGRRDDRRDGRRAARCGCRRSITTATTWTRRTSSASRRTTIPPLQAYIEKNLESTRRAVKAGVKIGMGSDAVYTMFGQNTRELGWFVKAGMTPAQALATATTTARRCSARQDPGTHRARLLRRSRRRRRRSARRHRRVVDRVRWVMKGGAVVVDRRK